MDKPSLQGLYQKIQSDKKLRTLVISGLCCIVVLAAIISVYSRSVLEVSVNDNVIGYVKDHEVLSAVKAEVKNRFEAKLGADGIRPGNKGYAGKGRWSQAFYRR